MDLVLVLDPAVDVSRGPSVEVLGANDEEALFLDEVLHLVGGGIGVLRDPSDNELGVVPEGLAVVGIKFRLQVARKQWWLLPDAEETLGVSPVFLQILLLHFDVAVGDEGDLVVQRAPDHGVRHHTGVVAHLWGLERHDSSLLAAAAVPVDEIGEVDVELLVDLDLEDRDVEEGVLGILDVRGALQVYRDARSFLRDVDLVLGVLDVGVDLLVRATGCVPRPRVFQADGKIADLLSEIAALLAPGSASKGVAEYLGEGLEGALLDRLEVEALRVGPQDLLDVLLVVQDEVQEGLLGHLLHLVIVVVHPLDDPVEAAQQLVSAFVGNLDYLLPAHLLTRTVLVDHSSQGRQHGYGHLIVLIDDDLVAKLAQEAQLQELVLTLRVVLGDLADGVGSRLQDALVLVLEEVHELGDVLLLLQEVVLEEGVPLNDLGHQLQSGDAVEILFPRPLYLEEPGNVLLALQVRESLCALFAHADVPEEDGHVGHVRVLLEELEDSLHSSDLHEEGRYLGGELEEGDKLVPRARQKLDQLIQLNLVLLQLLRLVLRHVLGPKLPLELVHVRLAEQVRVLQLPLDLLDDLLFEPGLPLELGLLFGVVVLRLVVFALILLVASPGPASSTPGRLSCQAISLGLGCLESAATGVPEASASAIFAARNIAGGYVHLSVGVLVEIPGPGLGAGLHVLGPAVINVVGKVGPGDDRVPPHLFEHLLGSVGLERSDLA